MTTRGLLAIDQGTTNSKAILVSAGGEILGRGAAPVPIEHPQPGWVQQDAEAIWQSVLEAASACLQNSGEAEIVAVGLSNQRESMTIWDRRSGAPLGPVVTWQCRRTTAACAALKAAGHEPFILETTGLPLDPLFPAPKLRWLIDEACARDPALSLDEICAGTVDSWLIARLTGGEVHATDRSNAARTQLFDLRAGSWNDRLCETFGVPREVLPRVESSAHRFGVTKGVPGLPDGLTIGSAIGDSHAALFGHGAFAPGDAKATFGTGSSVMATTDSFRAPRDGVTMTIAWALEGRSTYAYEGNIMVSASVLPWTAALLGLEDDVDALFSIAEQVEDTTGVAFVPALVGLGAPHWAPQARGLLSGLNFAADRRHVARAAVESIAFQVSDVFRVMRDQSPTPLGRLFADGGPSRNSFLMGLVADLLGHPLQQCDMPDVSALGAAHLAGLTAGVWDGPEALARLPRPTVEIAPRLAAAARDALLARWEDAVARCVLPPLHPAPLQGEATSR